MRLKILAVIALLLLVAVVGASTNLIGTTYVNQTNNFTYSYNGTIPEPVAPIIVGNTSTTNIDVSKTGGANDATFSTYYWKGQQFTPTSLSNGHLSQIGVYLKKTGSPTDTITIAIESDNSNAPSGTILASNTLAASSLTTSYTLQTIQVPALWSARFWLRAQRIGAHRARRRCRG